MKEEKRNFKVYMHIAPNGKKYIGITGGKVSRRWRKDGTGYKGQAFYNAIKKYGWDNFEHIIISDNLTQKEACQMEIDLIKKYKTTNKKHGYNRSTGGEISSVGSRWTQKQYKKFTKPIIQYTLDGKFVKEWNFLREIEESLGYSSTDISSCCLKKLRTSNGYVWRHRGDKFSLNENYDMIYQFTLNGEFIEQFRMIKDASQKIKCDHNSISKVCSYKIKQAGGYTWRRQSDPIFDKYKLGSKELKELIKKQTVPSNAKIRINQYSLDGIYIKTWESCRSIDKGLKVSRSTVVACCKGERLTAGGYKWKYAQSSHVSIS